MGGDDRLVAVPQQPGRKLHADLMGLFRGDFSGGKGVDQVVAQNAAGLSPAALGLLHIPVGAVQVTVDGRLQNGAAIRQSVFFRPADVVQHGGHIGFLMVQHIVHTMVQSGADGDDFVVGHVFNCSPSQKIFYFSRYCCIIRSPPIINLVLGGN